MAYQVWLFSIAGEKVAYLQNALDISRTERSNEAPTLFFALPADDPKGVYLTSAYQVKIWNTLKNRFEGLYDIDDATEKWDASGQFIDVNCSGVMAQLAREDNVTYDSGATALAPSEILTAMLALQERTPAITVGTIEPTTPFCISVENTNLLKAVLSCPDILGGYMEVDADRHLNWYNEPTGKPVREIRYKKNMKGVTRKRDYTQIVNRLYAYGTGESTAQLTLGNAMEFRFNQGGPAGVGPEIGETLTIHGTSIHCVVSSVLITYGSWAEGNAAGTIIATPPETGWDGEWTTGFFDASVAGESVANTTVIVKPNGYPNTMEYIEDTTSQAEYGPSMKRITDKRIIHPSTLLRWAQQVLAQYKDPIYYYTVDVVNLAVHPDFSFDLEELAIGQIVRVVNSDLNNLKVNVKIVSITTNLSIPMEVTLELANITRDLADTVNTVQTYTSLAQNVAVQIGAGQVVVQGTFTVDGWRSAGKTTINGGMITAKTITASQVNFAVADSTNIVATINASTEGITIAANKIAINGNCVFAAGYDPSGKVATGAAAADVNAGTTTINGGKITANSITADRLTVSFIEVGGGAADVNAGTTTISGTKITANSIDCNSLKTSTIDAKTITLANNATSIIQSAGFSSGSAGWQIKGNGNAEFNNVTVRGTIATCTLSSGSTLKVVGNIESNNYASGSAGWQLTGAGNLEIKDITINGDIVKVGAVTASGVVSGSRVDSSSTFKLTGTTSSTANGSIYTDNGVRLLWRDQSGGLHILT